MKAFPIASNPQHYVDCPWLTRLATPLLTALQYNFLLGWVFPSKSLFSILHVLDTLNVVCVQQWVVL